MTARPTVTVVTPTIGRIACLSAALASVAAQDVAVEHIVVGDDCEARGCAVDVAALVATVPGARFVDITAAALPADLQPYLPARIGFLRNAGARLGTGRYLAHLDDDNQFSSEHLASLVGLLEANPDSPVAHSWRRLVDDDGLPFVPDGVDPWFPEEDGRRASYDRLVAQGVFVRGSAEVRDRLWAGDVLVGRIDTGEFLIRRDYASVHAFPEHFTRGQRLLEMTEDMAYAVALGRRGIRPVCTNRPTLIYRMGGYSNADFRASGPRIRLRAGLSRVAA